MSPIKEQQAMGTIPVSVGLDYHTSFVQVCVVDDAGRVLLNVKCANSVQLVAERVAAVGMVRAAGIESCCGAADFAERLSQERGWSVSLAHPGYVNRMKNNPDKSDYSDAHLLADLARVGYLPKVWLAPAPVRDLRTLVRQRGDLVARRRALKLRILALFRERRAAEPPGTRWTKAYLRALENAEGLGDHGLWVVQRMLAELRYLDEELRATEKRLHQVTGSDSIVQRLLELPGIGPVTAWVMRAEIGEFGRFRTGKQLSRFCGLSPRNASSGQKQADAGLIRAGNPLLKCVLVEAAHRLGRLDPRWQALRQTLKAKGKPGSVIAAAIANRWMRWLFHQMKPQTTPSTLIAA